MAKLLDVLHELVDQGNTVVVIEHNLEVIKTADWIVDLGPEGGDAGGRVVAVGTPEDIAANPASYTGHYLKQVLERRRSKAGVSAPRSRGVSVPKRLGLARDRHRARRLRPVLATASTP